VNKETIFSYQKRGKIGMRYCLLVFLMAWRHYPSNLPGSIISETIRCKTYQKIISQLTVLCNAKWRAN